MTLGGEVADHTATLLGDAWKNYAALHEGPPVQWLDEFNAYVVTRHAEVLTALRDPGTFSSSDPLGAAAPGNLDRLMGALAAESAEMGRLVARFWETYAWAHPIVLLGADPPDHTRQRRILQNVFSARRMRQLAGFVGAVAQEQVDGLVDRGRMEFIYEFASPIASTVLGNALGCERDEVEAFRRWSDDLALGIGVAAAGPDSPPHRDRLEALARASIGMYDFLAEKVAVRREQARDDVISDIVHATYEGESLPERELMSILAQLVVAGQTTTADHLASTMLLLCGSPGLLDSARADLSLLPKVMDESLRLTPPASTVFRTVTKDTELGGVALPKGAQVKLFYGAANLDPAEFPDPERFDPLRKNLSRHLAFGQGNHYCMGAPLAKTVSPIVLETLLANLAEIEIDPENPPVFEQWVLTRRVCRLHLRFTG